MKRTIILAAALALLFGYAATVLATVTIVPLDQLEPTREQRQATLIIIRVIDKYHYKHLPLNDEASALIFDRYLESLDPNRSEQDRANVVQFTKPL